MNLALQKPMTLAEFLAWEERQELRYEFDGFGPVAMTGGTLEHEAIGGTLRSLLDRQTPKKPSKPFPRNLCSGYSAEGRGDGRRNDEGRGRAAISCAFLPRARGNQSVPRNAAEKRRRGARERSLVNAAKIHAE